MSKHRADAEYQRERRAKIKSGELVPGTKPRRSGVTATLAAGRPWIEVFHSRKDANEHQRSMGSVALRIGKVRCKTYVSVDPDTDLAVFIVETRRVEE